MKKIISILAAACLAAVAISSCQKLEPSTIEASDWMAQATAVISVTNNGAAVPSAAVIVTVSDGRKFNVTTDGAGNATLKIGCGASGVTVTASCSVYTGSANLSGADTKMISANGAKKLEVKLYSETL